MGHILFLSSFILLPLLIALILKLLNTQPNIWTYILNYLLLVFYTFINGSESIDLASTDVEGWAFIYSVVIFFIVAVVLAPISVWLQKVICQIFK